MSALCALRVTRTLAPTRLSVRARSVRSTPQLVAATHLPTMSVKELREELNQCKADYSDCFDADAMRTRLLTTLLIQAQNEAGPSPSNIPRAALRSRFRQHGLATPRRCLEVLCAVLCGASMGFREGPQDEQG